MTSNIYKEVLAILDTKMLSKDLFIIKWRVTESCNYQCSYCIRSYLTMCDQSMNNLKEQEDHLAEVAFDVRDLLNRIDKNVQIEIIGGEPSILNLKRILEPIATSCKNLKKITMTTNFSRPSKYYINLIDFLRKNNVDVQFTASFHSDFVTIERFFEKVNEVNEVFPHTIKVEIVSRKDNFDEVDKFRELAKEYKLIYSIERDLVNKDPSLIAESNIINKRYYKYDHEHNKITIKEEPFDDCTKVYGRYLVIYKDGTVEDIVNRNTLLTRKDIDIVEGGSIDLYRGRNQEKFKCTKDYNFINILYDKITSCRRDTMPIKDFIPFTKDELECTHSCSICGNLSLSTNVDLLESSDF